jgi:hypothetical protein
MRRGLSVARDTTSWKIILIEAAIRALSLLNKIRSSVLVHRLRGFEVLI